MKFKGFKLLKLLPLTKNLGRYLLLLIPTYSFSLSLSLHSLSHPIWHLSPNKLSAPNFNAKVLASCLFVCLFVSLFLSLRNLTFKSWDLLGTKWLCPDHWSWWRGRRGEEVGREGGRKGSVLEMGKMGAELFYLDFIVVCWLCWVGF
jgi:hypothetical protein